MRIREASRLGYKRILVPDSLKRGPRRTPESADKIEIVPVKTVGRAIEELG
jgi:hypothetical protein